MERRHTILTHRAHAIVQRIALTEVGAHERVLDAEEACALLRGWFVDAREDLRRIAMDPTALDLSHAHRLDDVELEQAFRRAFEREELVVLEPLPTAVSAPESFVGPVTETKSALVPVTAAPIEKTWFELRVVDVYGDPIEGVRTVAGAIVRWGEKTKGTLQTILPPAEAFATEAGVP